MIAVEALEEANGETVAAAEVVAEVNGNIVLMNMAVGENGKTAVAEVPMKVREEKQTLASAETVAATCIQGYYCTHVRGKAERGAMRDIEAEGREIKAAVEAQQAVNESRAATKIQSHTRGSFARRGKVIVNRRVSGLRALKKRASVGAMRVMSKFSTDVFWSYAHGKQAVGDKETHLLCARLHEAQVGEMCGIRNQSECDRNLGFCMTLPAKPVRMRYHAGPKRPILTRSMSRS